jgi:putative ABC transport system permease protein
MSHLAQDLRYAFRTLAKSPGFTAAAVLTLALGIGANTAVFSVVNAVLLHPLAFPQEDRLVTVWEDLSARGGAAADWTGRSVFQEWRRTEAFSGLTVTAGWAAAVTDGDRPEMIPGARVSPSYFTVLGVDPAPGRGFLPDEETPGKDHVVVLSRGLWEQRYGAEPSVVGSTLDLNGTPYRVVGIAPEGFRPPIESDAQLWSPLDVDPADPDWGNYYLRVIGRLAPGVGVEAAEAQLESVMDRLGEEHPADLRGVGVALEPLRTTVAGDSRTPLLVLLGAVLLVLLVACANVANLVLARAFARDRELAVRTALGAGRRRLVAQLVTESLALAAVGGALGLVMGLWGMEVLKAYAPAGTPRLDEVGLDGSVFLFVLAATAITGLLFGLVPGWLVSRSPVATALHEGGRTGSSAGRARLRAGLVVAELALGLALLVGAGLLVRSLVALHAVSPGFEPAGITSGRLLFPSARFPEASQAAAFVDRAIERLESAPEVASAGAVSVLPLSGSQIDVSYVVEGRVPPPGEEPAADYRAATPTYFETLGIPVVRGRSLGPGDDADAPLVAVVSEELARRAFPDEDPVGRRIKVGGVRDPESPWITVVGVVGGVRDNALNRTPDPEIYLPAAQRPSRVMRLVVRAERPGVELAETLRGAVAALDSSQPVAEVVDLETLVRDSLAPQRFVTGLLAAFAAMALLLAGVGIYGVMSYAVGRRTHEIGVRMALGARPREVLALVLRQGALLVALGLGLGAIAAWGVGRGIAGLLYGVEPGDPATFAAVAGLLALCSLAATLLPALRASRTDPVEALRIE